MGTVFLSVLSLFLGSMERFYVAPFPLFSNSDYTIDFFFQPVVPATAVITIYLGSLFHYSRAAAKNRRKSAVLYDL